MVEAPVVAAGATGVCDEAHREAVREELQDMCLWSAYLTAVEAPLSPWGGTPHGGFADVHIAVDRKQIRMLPAGAGQWILGEGFPLGEQEPIDFSEFAGELAALSSRENKDVLMWSLQIASDVPSAVVADVLRVLADAKMLRGQLELRTSEGPAAVRDPALHLKLNASRKALAPEQRMAWTKQELERFAGSCLAFEEIVEVATSVDSSQSCLALATGLAVALGDCACERESEVLTVMYTAAFGAAPAENRVTPVRATISAHAKPRRGETWGSIVAGLEKDDALSLWVSGEE